MTTMMRPSLAGALVLVMAFGVARAEAQQTPAPSRDAPPPAPQPVAAPALLPPPATATPPSPVPARAAAPAPSAAQSAAATPLAQPGGSALPPDSVRPAAATVRARPANAIAQCGDGTFVVPPQDASACRGREGVLTVMPQGRTPPPRPTAAAALVAAPLVDPTAPPPDGATMRCKDGTYLFGAPSAGRCGANGGVAAELPAPRTAPAAPPEVRRP